MRRVVRRRESRGRAVRRRSEWGFRDFLVRIRMVKGGGT